MNFPAFRKATPNFTKYKIWFCYVEKTEENHVEKDTLMIERVSEGWVDLRSCTLMNHRLFCSAFRTVLWRVGGESMTVVYLGLA